MTVDDIVRMAREAADGSETEDVFAIPFLERFAAIVAAAEREACAKVCDEEAMEERDDWAMRRIEACARVIRARGNQ